MIQLLVQSLSLIHIQMCIRDRHMDVHQLTDFILDFFLKAKDNPLFQVLTSGELELLAMKLPPRCV